MLAKIQSTSYHAGKNLFYVSTYIYNPKTEQFMPITSQTLNAIKSYNLCENCLLREDELLERKPLFRYLCTDTYTEITFKEGVLLFELTMFNIPKISPRTYTVTESFKNGGKINPIINVTSESSILEIEDVHNKPLKKLSYLYHFSEKYIVNRSDITLCVLYNKPKYFNNLKTGIITSCFKEQLRFSDFSNQEVFLGGLSIVGTFRHLCDDASTYVYSTQILRNQYSLEESNEILTPKQRYYSIDSRDPTIHSTEKVDIYACRSRFHRKIRKR